MKFVAQPTEPTPRFDAHRADTQFTATSTKYLFPAERSLLKLRSKQTRKTNNFLALFWGEFFSSTRRSTQIFSNAFSPTRGMACVMSHVILVSQSYCRVNDHGGKIPAASLLFVWSAGRSSPEICRMLSQRKILSPFKAKWVLILQTIFEVCHRKIIAELWSLGFWEQRGNPIYGLLSWKLKSCRNLKTKQLHTKVNKDLIFPYQLARFRARG